MVKLILSKNAFQWLEKLTNPNEEKMVPIFLKLSSIGIWFLQGVCSTCGEEPWNVPQTWQHVYLPVVAKVTKSLDGLWYGSHRTGETGQEQTEPNTTEKQE